MGRWWWEATELNPLRCAPVTDLTLNPCGIIMLHKTMYESSSWVTINKKITIMLQTLLTADKDAQWPGWRCTNLKKTDVAPQLLTSIKYWGLISDLYCFFFFLLFWYFSAFSSVMWTKYTKCWKLYSFVCMESRKRKGGGDAECGWWENTIMTL